MKNFKVLKFKQPFNTGAMEEQFGLLSAEGFEFVSSDSSEEYVVYVFSKKERAQGGTAFPSEKQIGYVAWAYQTSGEEIEKERVSRQECSKLIDAHKTDTWDTQYPAGSFPEALKELRKDKEAEYDKNIPF